MSCGGSTTPYAADQIQHMEGKLDRDYFLPIVADAEAGFGGPLNAFELMKGMIEAGRRGSALRRSTGQRESAGTWEARCWCPPVSSRTLTAARLAADVLDVPTVLVARTDANSAQLITSDVDPRDQRFITGDRTAEGFHKIEGGLDIAIARGLSYAPTPICCGAKPASPTLAEAQGFAEAIHAEFPESCWPTTARPRSIGRRSSMTPRRAVPSAS